MIYECVLTSHPRLRNQTRIFILCQDQVTCFHSPLVWCYILLLLLVQMYYLQFRNSFSRDTTCNVIILVRTLILPDFQTLLDSLSLARNYNYDVTHWVQESLLIGFELRGRSSYGSHFRDCYNNINKQTSGSPTVYLWYCI